MDVNPVQVTVKPLTADHCSFNSAPSETSPFNIPSTVKTKQNKQQQSSATLKTEQNKKQQQQSLQLHQKQNKTNKNHHQKSPSKATSNF